MRNRASDIPFDQRFPDAWILDTNDVIGFDWCDDILA